LQGDQQILAKESDSILIDYQLLIRRIDNLSMERCYESGNIQRSNGKAFGAQGQKPSVPGPTQGADEGLYSATNAGESGDNLEGQFRQGVDSYNRFTRGKYSPSEQINKNNQGIADLGAMPASFYLNIKRILL
jgi:hypothetical protein